MIMVFRVQMIGYHSALILGGQSSHYFSNDSLFVEYSSVLIIESITLNGHTYVFLTLGRVII